MKLKIAAIIIEDELGNKYPVNISESPVGKSSVINVPSKDSNGASLLMASALVGGGINAVYKLFKN